MSERPKRSTPSDNHVRTKPNRTDLVFVTVCVLDRRLILATERMQKIILGAWSKADHWAVGRYVLMPDHAHFFCTPLNWERDFDNWVKFWKRLVTQSAGLGRFWQAGCWDTQIRDRRMYDEKWEYTYNNPVRAGLVQRPQDWPFQGEVNVIRYSGD